LESSFELSPSKTPLQTKGDDDRKDGNKIFDLSESEMDTSTGSGLTSALEESQSQSLGASASLSMPSQMGN